MTVTVKSIIPAKYAEAAQTTQYTATSRRTIVDKFTLTNTSAAAVVFSLNLAPSGGSAAAFNLIIDGKTIVPGETYLCPEIVGHMLNPGDFISTIADTASALVIAASGREIT